MKSNKIYNMKSFINISLSVVLTGSFITSGFKATAGNPERAGQAGASQLLINPYGRSAGWAGANGALSGREARAPHGRPAEERRHHARLQLDAQVQAVHRVRGDQLQNAQQGRGSNQGAHHGAYAHDYAQGT